MELGPANVGSIIKTPDGILWRVQMIGGSGGGVRYACISLDRLVREKRYLAEGDFKVVAQRG